MQDPKTGPSSFDAPMGHTLSPVDATLPRSTAAQPQAPWGSPFPLRRIYAAATGCGVPVAIDTAVDGVGAPVLVNCWRTNLGFWISKAIYGRLRSRFGALVEATQQALGAVPKASD